MTMRLIFTLWIFSFATAYDSDTVLKTTSRQYKRMLYLPVTPLLAQYDINSKHQCIAQCARLASTCNIAVFNPTATPHCALYGESLIVANLIPSANTIVVDFRRVISQGGLGCLSSTGITALSSYNLITFGDLTIQYAVDRRTITCGSLFTGMNVEFAKTIDSSVFPATSDSLEINQLIVSGAIVKVYAGSVSIGIAFTHTIATSDSISYIIDGHPFQIMQGSQGARIYTSPYLASKCIGMENDIKTLSSELLSMAYTPENYIIIPRLTPVAMQFYVNRLNANGMAVFNLDGNILLNNLFIQSIEIVVNSSITNNVQLVVINVSGLSIVYVGGPMVGTWLSSVNPGQSQTIWNFYQATLITLNQNWMGALLAPYALVNINAGINGAIAAKTVFAIGKVRDPPITVPSCV